MTACRVPARWPACQIRASCTAVLCVSPVQDLPSPVSSLFWVCSCLRGVYLLVALRERKQLGAWVQTSSPPHSAAQRHCSIASCFQGRCCDPELFSFLMSLFAMFFSREPVEPSLCSPRILTVPSQNLFCFFNLETRIFRF